MSKVESFRDGILGAGALDSAGVHRVFSSGVHGQKLDFSVVENHEALYGQWVEVTVEAVEQQCRRMPDALLSVANGTNRLAVDAAARLGVQALLTEKVGGRAVALSAASRTDLAAIYDPFVVVLEDVGTSGATARMAAESAQQYGATAVFGLFAWQRCRQLTAFEECNMPYGAVIVEPLPAFDPQACTNEGYCAQGWLLISAPAPNLTP